MTVWFTSDIHLGHRAVAGMRGFRDPAEHDAILAERWRSHVRQSDTVVVLGDLSLANSAAQVGGVVDWFAALPGIKHLVSGNHDPVHPMHRQAHLFPQIYLREFASVASAATRRLGGHRVLLSHFPYTGDHTPTDRYQQWRMPDLGLPLLHGHIHSASVGPGHQIHVGLDAWGLAPVSDEQVLDVMRTNGVIS